jgi:glucosyl-dolichyl phosphate glucuronosyltransferase
VCGAVSMKVSVILCTFNRCKSLARALESLAALELPKSDEWEILIVDNNSNDQTRSVADSFCRRYPTRFRYLFEPRQGKSFALNSGIREGNGTVLAFVDDDVTVQPTWLHSLIDPLRDAQWAGSGGRILPEPGFSPPPWLALEGPLSLLGALCAYFDQGDLPESLQKPPVGANMAFRREMFAKYGGFREDLGPKPGSELRSEDTEFGRRLLARGERLCYAPSAIVFHEINHNRVRKDFFLSWWFAFGRGHIRESQTIPSITEILKIFARIILTTPKWVLGVNSQHRFYCKCRIWYEAGKIVEVYQLRWREKANAAVP